jgi:uncharacterized protein (TIGR00159 family)
VRALATLLGQFLPRMSPWEIVTSVADILVVYYLVYRALLLVRGTRAAQMLTTLVLVGATFFVAKVLELGTLTWLLDNLLNYSIIFFIVIFQGDIRRALTRVGANLFGAGRQYEETYVFEEVIQAAEQLAQARRGALILFEREAELEEFFRNTGELIDGRVSRELLVALFLPSAENTLHDGAAVIKNLRLQRAGCVLPLSNNPKLDKSLGTRHRAAIGITEETDAVAVVVSEERGTVSLCFAGNIARDLEPATLRKALLGLFQKERREPRSRRERQPTQKIAIRPATVAASAQTQPATVTLTMAPIAVAPETTAPVTVEPPAATAPSAPTVPLMPVVSAATLAAYGAATTLQGMPVVAPTASAGEPLGAAPPKTGAGD